MTPEPGIYYDVPFVDYLAWEAESNSKLSLLDISPRAYQLGRHAEPTKPMRIGSLAHCGVLEPIKFAERYAVMPDFCMDKDNCTADGRPTTSQATAYVKTKKKAFADLNPGREIVDRTWYDQTLAIVREISANEVAAKLLSNPHPAEVSIVWEERGVAMKARIDKLGDGKLIDLKTTNDASTFENAIGRYGYHRQMAHYAAGWHALTGKLMECWLVAVEPSAPHTVLAAKLSDDALSEGYAARARLLDGLEACRVANQWPPRPNPRQWELPAWASEPIELIHNQQEVSV